MAGQHGKPPGPLVGVQLTGQRARRAPGRRLTDEFVNFLAGNINPIDLAAPPSFFDNLNRHVPKRCVALRLAMAIDEYDPKSVERRIRPQPDMCTLYSRQDFEKIASREKEITGLNTLLNSTRAKCKGALCESLGENGGLDALHLWERAAVRLCFQKPQLAEFAHLTCAKGKYAGAVRHPSVGQPG